MVGVVVTRGDDINEVQARRIDHALCHAHMRLIGGRVFLRQRVGQVRIEQQVLALKLHQKSTLAQPPKTQIVVVLVGRAYIREEIFILEDWLDHAIPSPACTSLTPSTRAFSFCFDAQRAVWLSPQSGANDNRSAGANSRHLRTRAAISSGVSM